MNDKLANRRLVARSFGGAIASAMAETDTSFAAMAKRLNCSEQSLRRSLMMLIDGISTVSPDRISDMVFACGCYLRFGLRPGDRDAPDDNEPRAAMEGKDG